MDATITNPEAKKLSVESRLHVQEQQWLSGAEISAYAKKTARVLDLYGVLKDTGTKFSEIIVSSPNECFKSMSDSTSFESFWNTGKTPCKLRLSYIGDGVTLLADHDNLYVNPAVVVAVRDELESGLRSVDIIVPGFDRVTFESTNGVIAPTTEIPNAVDFPIPFSSIEELLKGVNSIEAFNIILSSAVDSILPKEAN